MTSIGFGVGLAAIWVLLWGTASPANVLGGLAVGFMLVAILPGLRRRRGWPTVRPLALARLTGYMLANAVRSNVVLTREVLARRTMMRTGVVGVRLPDCSDELVTVISSLLALTPGTMPLELAEAPRTLYVHVLHLDAVEDVRHDIEHLTALAVLALGSAADIASVPDAWRKPR